MVGNINRQEIGKVSSRIKREFNSQSDIIKCKICGLDIKSAKYSFHRSHGIPRFVLENIKEDVQGNLKVASSSAILNFDQFNTDDYVGLSSAGIFYLICPECDQNYFNLYESEKKLTENLEPIALSSIALKTTLKEYFDSFYKYKFSKMNFDTITDNKIIELMLEAKASISGIVAKSDMRDFDSDFKYELRSIEKEVDSNLLLYSTLLNYTVPIAVQASISISKNIDFSTIQNIHLTNPHRIESLYLAIFPLKKQTRILLFTRRDNKKMRLYFKQFKKLDEDSKLRELFYLAIRYKNTNLYFSPLIVSTMKKNSSIKEIMSTSDEGIQFGLNKLLLSDFENQDIRKKLPNLLGEQYSIQKLKSSSLEGEQ